MRGEGVTGHAAQSRAARRQEQSLVTGDAMSEDLERQACAVWSAVRDAARAISSVGDAVGLSSIHLGVLSAELAEWLFEVALDASCDRHSHVTPDPVGPGFIRIIGYGADVDGVHIGWQCDVPATEEEYAEYCRQEERRRQRAVRQEAQP